MFTDFARNRSYSLSVCISLPTGPGLGPVTLSCLYNDFDLSEPMLARKA
jgi:hypothetical protein